MKAIVLVLSLGTSALAASALAVSGVATTSAAQTTDELSRRQAWERYRSGQELLQSERYDEAEREFSAAVELDPLLAPAHYGLGQTFMVRKRYASAIQAFLGCRNAYLEIGNMRQRGAFDADRRLIEEMQELRDSITRVRSGQIRNAGPALLQQLEARLDELERMRGTKVGERITIPAEVSLALGSAYFRNGALPEAEREWAAAVAVNARLGEAQNNLAVLYMMTGRKTEAENAVRAAERANFRVNPQLKRDIQAMADNRGN
jgi:tetratricopeptide (TPR) repeat protein